ncbi:hypothetical protein TNCV_2393261 [Trichonephila clavipes]|nr:hypothetical protein TNCV_2393261 [Trichonephila clavipes]
MGQYDDDKCTLPMCIRHNCSKHGCEHLDALNRIWIYLKKLCLAIREARFVVDQSIEDAPVCDVASWVAAAMVSERRVHAAEKVVELFVQALTNDLNS